MERGESARPSKQERRAQRRRAARLRRLRRRLGWASLIAAALGAAGLWSFDQTGPSEQVMAEVIETRRWRHVEPGGSSHPHTAATLRIEGLSETTLDRADGYIRGQRVPVWIRRGRISDWPYFRDVVRPGEGADPDSP